MELGNPHPPPPEGRGDEEQAQLPKNELPGFSITFQQRLQAQTRSKPTSQKTSFASKQDALRLQTTQIRSKPTSPKTSFFASEKDAFYMCLEKFPEEKIKLAEQVRHRIAMTARSPESDVWSWAMHGMAVTKLGGPRRPSGSLAFSKSF